jgi:RNA polymerase sigma-70 factor (ECF subfamily)
MISHENHEIAGWMSRFRPFGYLHFVSTQPGLSPTRSGSGPSDAALVVAARAGEAWAMEALFRRYAPMVNGMALRLMGRDADVDDLVQETFAQALGGLEGLKEPQAFAKWVSSIVARTVYKTIRKRRLLARLGLGRGSLAVDVDTLISSSAPADESAELRRVYALLERLPAELRVPLILRRVENLPLEQVAEMVGCSLATVKRRIALAEEKLRGGTALKEEP